MQGRVAVADRVVRLIIGSAHGRTSFRGDEPETRNASKIRRSVKLRTSDTAVKMPAINKFSAAEIEMPKTGKIATWTMKANARPTATFVAASANDIVRDCVAF